MAVSGQYLYYGQKQGYPSNQRKFLVIDVSIPQNPVHVGSLPRWSGGGCIASNDENVFFTGNDSYLSVYPAACSAVSSVPIVGPRSGGPVLIGNYPNPFNPSTSTSYWLSEEASVSLGVYDLGVYLYRLNVDGYLDSGRMVLTK